MTALAMQPYPMSTTRALPSDDELVKRALESARIRWELSARETGVLEHLAEGDSNKTIAAKLSCALRTIEAHVTAILQKSGCESRAQVVAHFWRGQ